MKTGWLASCITALVAFDLIVRNIQAVRASPAMVQKKDTFRLVGDYQAVNSQVEQTSKVMTDLLRDLDCNVWVDDVLYFTEDEISLLCLQDEILVRLESVAVHSPCDADDSLPSVDGIRAAQRKAVPDLGDNLRSFPTTSVKLPRVMMTCFVCVSGIVMFCGFRLGCLLYTSPSPRD